jgi:hypothetical protein
LIVAVAVAAPAGTANDDSYLHVWVHYDYMVGPDHSDAPNPAAIQMVVDAFKAHGVTLHIDPQHTAIPDHRVIVPDWPSFYASQPGIDDPSCAGPDAVRFSDLRARYFRPTSNHAWHYAVFGDYAFTDAPAESVNCPVTSETGGVHPTPGMSGASQVGFLDVPGGFGYSFVVALESFRDAGIDPDAHDNARFEAGAFMHELGHNLGLCHSGPVTVPYCLANNAPNYISVMNFAFNFGIPFAATPGSTAIAGWRVDYSDVKLPDLDETCLDETAGLQDTVHPMDVTHKFGRPTLYPVLGPADWNENGDRTEACVSVNLDNDLVRRVLPGADDWAWLHSRLTPAGVTGFFPAGAAVGEPILVRGVNLIGPLTVIFTGGVFAVGENIQYDNSPDTSFSVTVPPGAKSGPITVVTPEGKATSAGGLTVPAS